jgi:4-hydroxy-tetrahydrodipicolinate synthase
LYVKLYQAAKAKDAAQISPLQANVMQVCQRIYNAEPGSISYLKGLKCALSLLGICPDTLAGSWQKFQPPSREKIKQFLLEIGLAKH